VIGLVERPSDASGPMRGRAEVIRSCTRSNDGVRLSLICLRNVLTEQIGVWGKSFDRLGLAG